MIKKPKDNAQLALFNTFILYLKMLYTIVVSLYTFRIVLSALGSLDYGVFALIAGVVAMLTFINSAMTVSTQRYLSFHQGKGDLLMQKKIFVNSLVIHILIGLIITLALLLISPFLFDGFLNIQADRIPAARIVYYTMIASVFFTIVSVPFTAVLNANENMLWISVVLMVQTTLKLLIAVLLFNFMQVDRLEYYAYFMALVTIVSFFMYAIFCFKKYEECKINHYEIDKPLIKELGSFAGWNLYTNIAYVANTEGTNVMFNLFFGTMVNTAYGIGSQVNNQIKNLAKTLLQVLNPQIMRSEGMNDRDRMIRLSMIASKSGFFLVTIISIPSIFEMETILELWLTEVPDYAVLFCSFFLLSTIINQITSGVAPAIQAIGNIKKYQVIIGTFALLNLPISYYLLKIGQPIFTVLLVLILIEVISSFIKIKMFSINCKVKSRDYLKSVIINFMVPALLNFALIYMISLFVFSKFGFLISFGVSFITFPFLFYFFGINSSEKSIVISLVGVLKRRILNKRT